jgi:hypothetical protein
LYEPDSTVTEDPSRKATIGVLDIASAQGKPWIEDPIDSVAIAGKDSRASDVFTLLKRDGNWKITHKLFHWHDSVI